MRSSTSRPHRSGSLKFVTNAPPKNLEIRIHPDISYKDRSFFSFCTADRFYEADAVGDVAEAFDRCDISEVRHFRELLESLAANEESGCCELDAEGAHFV